MKAWLSFNSDTMTTSKWVPLPKQCTNFLEGIWIFTSVIPYSEEKMKAWCWLATGRLWRAVLLTLLSGWQELQGVLLPVFLTTDLLARSCSWVITPAGQSGLVWGRHTLKECATGSVRRRESEKEKDFGIWQSWSSFYRWLVSSLNGSVSGHLSSLRTPQWEHWQACTSRTQTKLQSSICDADSSQSIRGLTCRSEHKWPFSKS